MSGTVEKRNYRKTLNLPKTGFDMRAKLAQNEPASVQRWQDMGLVDRLREERADADPFIFHDGPPYANGDLHVGHLLNKVLKDIVVRSRHLAGKRVDFIPGWDCHGLPIEHRVMTQMHEDGMAGDLDGLDENDRRMAIRTACRIWAETYVSLQSDRLQQMLTHANYREPYLTMDGSYERSVLAVFASLLSEGLVYRDVKPVHWSIAHQTALAEAELEYQDRQDLSVFVRCDAVDPQATWKALGIEGDGPIGFLVWTTTPWTLPANMAIAVHEKVQYAVVDGEAGAVIVAADLHQAIASRCSLATAVRGTVAGERLVGMAYRHPCADRECPLVHATYVTLDEGTGLVHTAPGHGTDDYHTGLAHDLDIYCPVQEDGTFDDSVPAWLQGLSVWDANDVIAEHLRETGHLHHAESFTHSYPHDWRSKTPVIFRATEQWFIGVDRPMQGSSRTLRSLALEQVEDIEFIPGWGRNRFRGMLETRPDWCLSRQRAWGLPIPAFRMPGGEILMTPATVEAVAEVFGARGSDAWFTMEPGELLASWDADSDADAPDGIDPGTLEKLYDIFDVWMESGASWHAVMRQREIGFPSDLYLEGTDQHRGWFQLSLLPALGMLGEAPFRKILTHGFMVDRDGRKMSKSGGNALAVKDLLREHGADVCRWWVSSIPFENDFKVDPSFFVQAGESYRKVRNTMRFLIGNLSDYDGSAVDPDAVAPTSPDAWILDALAMLSGEVMDAYEGYQFRRVHQLIYDFCNERLSSFYCTAMKDRLYCDRVDSTRRRTTQGVMQQILDVLCRLLAPIIPHTADEAFRALPGREDACVHLLVCSPVVRVPLDPDWETVFAARDEVMKALEAAKEAGIENPLEAEVVLPDPSGVLGRFEADMADMLGVSRVLLVPDAAAVEVRDIGHEPRCDRSWKRDGTVSLRSDGGMLSDRDAEVLGL